MSILTSFSAKHFDINNVGEKPKRTVLHCKFRYFSVKFINYIFKLECNHGENMPGMIARSDAHLPGMRTVTGSSGNILSWTLVMK